MITVAAVHAGDYLGRGTEYVANLFSAVRRHLSVPWRGVCLTDNTASVPEGIEALPLPGGMAPSWWTKLAMFSPGMFKPGERVLYLDLDSVIIGSPDDFAAYRGRLAIMSDVFHPEHYQSSIMAWEAGTLDGIWNTWDRGGRPTFDRRGDQRWIEQMAPGADRWQELLPGQMASYKRDCAFQGGPPNDARLIIFHGLPRPHEVETPWVQKAWSGT